MPILFNIENTLIKHAFFVKNSNKRTSLLLSKLASDKLDALSRIFHTKSIAIKQSVVNSQTSLKKIYTMVNSLQILLFVRHIMQYINYFESPLGTLTMASDGEALTGLWFVGQKYYGATLGTEYMEANLPIFIETKRWLDCYFAGQKPNFTPKLAPMGSEFRQQVWAILQTIPYGSTLTYSEIAAQIVKARGVAKMSAQAVGGAVGHNPISIIIPCHRVVGANGSLTGYAGGIDRKIALLEIEKEAKINL